MYHTLLTNRYLTSRIIPLIAVAAVALCVALVVIVVSVMSGFLDMLKKSGRTLMGDVVVSYPIRGIPHYERLLEIVRGLPEAAAAAPIIDTYGLLRMPYPPGDEKEIVTVQVWAVDPATFNDVTGFDDTLWWRPVEGDARARLDPDDLRLRVPEQLLRDGMELRDSRSGKPGIVPGIHVSALNKRQHDATYRPSSPGWWMPMHNVSLTLVPIGGGGKIAEPKEVIFPVVNEFFSGVYQVDKQRVIIPLADAQQMLRMNAATRTDPRELDEEGRPRVIGVDPAKVTKVLVRAKDGVTPERLRQAVSEAYDRFELELAADETAVVKPPPRAFVSVLTWEELLRDLIAPVEKEREMMRILFSIIYLVCAGLVLSIFWAIVYEKTRDIGILRSVGAPRSGIVWIFLRYGLVIGAVGAVIGVGLAWLVVWNINAIHEAIGRDAPRWSWIAAFACAMAAAVAAATMAMRQRLLATLLWGIATGVLGLAGVGLLLHHGVLVWDPSVYYFARIPSQLDLFTAALTMVGAVVFSVVGASIPAARAADTDPVKALRYE
ncbi:MAG: FtsX-like permease family protein [Phycisphaerales bacterium]